MTLRDENWRRIFWICAIAVTTLIAIFSTVFSLTHGIHDVFPFLYFMPVILFVYFYPNRGVLFTLCISTIFVILVYYFGNFNASLVATSTAWFVIFVTIGVITSSFAEGLKDEERKYQGIFENSQAGIFTFDLLTLRISELNDKCSRMLHYDRQELLGKDLANILVDSPGKESFLHNLHKHARIGDAELLFQTKDRDVRQFLVSASVTLTNSVVCSAIDITEQKLADQVIQKAKRDLEQRVKERTEVLQKINEELKTEIQERKQFEAAIQLANRKLNTLSSITRHDILNQITAIVMYLSMSEDMVTDPVLLGHLKKIEQITQLIQKQIRFTRDYQNIGSTTPQWQNVGVTIDNAIKNFDLGGVRIENNLSTLEVYADFLFERVFYNLVENSLRHGEKVTVIRFFSAETKDGLAIICEDDGVGVPISVKEKIFKRE
jgi:PAS domain S-box-containing protein